MTCLSRSPDRVSGQALREQKRRLNFLSCGLLAATLAAIASNAWSACSVNVQGVNFGNYDPFGRSNLDGAGNIAVTCDLAVTYTIALSSGGGAYTATDMAKAGY
jgi:spore coat protein U-like protein